jgi:transposase-like protein
VKFIVTRRLWECKGAHPRKQFSAKVGTIFEDSPLGLDKWFAAIWLIANCKNGVSSYEIHRGIGVTQKTAWFMLHRIRLAMQTGSFIKSGGTFEADETFVGGKSKNMSATRRAKTITGSGVSGKEVVMGVLKRGTAAEASTVTAKHIPNRRKSQVQAAVRDAAEPGSTIYTDALMSYAGLAADYVHEAVDHAVEFVRDNVHTNGMENFWSLFKRALKGTYVAVEPMHLNAYVKEQTFRFNERKTNDGNRFRSVLGNVSGKRITYKELIGHVSPAA